MVHSPVLRAQSQNSNVIELKTNSLLFIPSAFWLKKVTPTLINSDLPYVSNISGLNYATEDKTVQIVSDQVSQTVNFKINQWTNQGSDFVVQVDLKQVQLKAENVLLHAEIQKDFDFGSAHLNLHVGCSNMAINLENTIPALIRFKLKNGLVEITDIQWSDSAIKIRTDLNQCTNVPGFDQTLKNQILQNFQVDYVKRFLQQIIDQQFNSQLNQRLRLAVDRFLNQNNVSIQNNIQIDDKNNIWIYTAYDPAFKFSSEHIRALSNSTSPTLLTSKTSLEQLIKTELNSFLTKNIMSSKTDNNLNKLTCSRLIQTFVWPSLKSLDKCFELQISHFINKLTVRNLNQLQIDIDIQTQATSAQAPTPTHKIADFKSNVQINLQNKFFTLGAFNGAADADFIKWAQRSKRISIQMIQPKIENLLQSALDFLAAQKSIQMYLNNVSSTALSEDIYLMKINIP